MFHDKEKVNLNHIGYCTFDLMEKYGIKHAGKFSHMPNARYLRQCKL